jgi:hypothetical protein
MLSKTDLLLPNQLDHGCNNQPEKRHERGTMSGGGTMRERQRHRQREAVAACQEVTQQSAGQEAQEAHDERQRCRLREVAE